MRSCVVRCEFTYATTFQRWNVGAVLWTNSPTGGGGDYRADSSQAALAAYQQAGDMAFFGR